jgi:hypothetical protein
LLTSNNTAIFGADVRASGGEAKDFQFLVDSQGEKIAVLLDFSSPRRTLGGCLGLSDY